MTRREWQPEAEIRWSRNGARVCCHERGFSVAGPGFYVWDEHLLPALERASLLQREPSTPSGSPQDEARSCGPMLFLPGP